MATKEISGLTELAEKPNDADFIPMRDSSAVADRKVLAKYFVKTTDGLPVEFTGGGTGVTVAKAQSLSNKTLVTPTIASFSNATHNHTNAAGGGTLSTYATLTGAETLTNKTLTTPTIASFVNATHDHSSAAQGGTLAGGIADHDHTYGDAGQGGVLISPYVQSGTFDGTLTFNNNCTVDLYSASTFVIPFATVASSTASGTQGQFCFDADYMYFCISEDVWRRDKLETGSW